MSGDPWMTLHKKMNGTVLSYIRTCSLCVYSTVRSSITCLGLLPPQGSGLVAQVLDELKKSRHTFSSRNFTISSRLFFVYFFVCIVSSSRNPKHARSCTDPHLHYTSFWFCHINGPLHVGYPTTDLLKKDQDIWLSKKDVEFHTLIIMAYYIKQDDDWSLDAKHPCSKRVIAC